MSASPSASPSGTGLFIPRTGFGSGYLTRAESAARVIDLLVELGNLGSRHTD